MPNRSITKAVQASFSVVAFLTLSAQGFSQDLSAARVTVMEVKEDQLIEELDLTGTVTAERRAMLSSRTSGLVQKMHVDAGDPVEKGQALMELEPALAEVAVARARNAVIQAEASLSEAQRLADEVLKLAETRAVAQSEVRARQAATTIAESEVDQLQAELRGAEEILARHTLPAPFAGVISRKGSELGEWVETGATVFELVDTKQLRIDVQAPQEWFHVITVGTEANVFLKGDFSKPLKAKVRAKVPVQDAVARTFLMLLDVDDTEDRMSPGMSVFAKFSVPSTREALIVPRDAILRLPNGTVKLWVVNENGDSPIAQDRDVTLGTSSGAWVEIRDGVDVGERVVIRGNENLRAGQPLEIIPSDNTIPSPAT